MANQRALLPPPATLLLTTLAGLAGVGGLALLAGCGAGGDAPRHARVRVDTVDGVETLTYGEGPAEALGWEADTVAVLGDAFAEDAYQFNEVSSERLAGDGAGTLYVLDPQGGRVLRYDADGRHLATTGRSGEGPGELGQPLGLAVGPGDTAWVSDFSNSRLTGYPPDGGEPRTVAFPDNAGIPNPRMAATDDGFILLFRPIFAFRRDAGGQMAMSRPGGDDGADVQRMPLLRFDRELTPTDTLWVTPEPPMDMVRIETGDRMVMSMMSREFWPAFQWGGFSDGGVVISDSAAYVLQLVDARGRVTRVIRRPPAPRTTTEADRELARQRLRDQSDEGTRVRIGGGGPGEDVRRRMLEQQLEQMTFAEVVPRVVRLLVDPRDRIWVGVSEETADEVERIDVYSREGELLGELRGLPFPDVFIGPDRIGVLRRDELDVQQVVLLAVEEPEPGD